MDCMLQINFFEPLPSLKEGKRGLIWCDCTQSTIVLNSWCQSHVLQLKIMKSIFKVPQNLAHFNPEHTDDLMYNLPFTFFPCHNLPP